MTDSAVFWKHRYEKMRQLKTDYEQIATDLVGRKGRDTHIELLKAEIERWKLAHELLAIECGMSHRSYLKYLIAKDLIKEGF